METASDKCINVVKFKKALFNWLMFQDIGPTFVILELI